MAGWFGAVYGVGGGSGGLATATTVANQAARLALSENDDVQFVVQTDTEISYVLPAGSNPSVNSNWIALPQPSTAGLAALASPTFTGHVTVPTPTSSTDAATKAYVDSAGGSSGLTVTTQSGTAYTLVLGDANSCIDFTNASAVVVTVPLHASVAWTLGTIINICCQGAGGLSITSSGTIHNNASALTAWQEVSLRYDGSDVWVRLG